MTFFDVAGPSFGQTTNFTAVGDTKLNTSTVGQLPAVVDTQVCTVTDCSAPSSFNNDLSDVLFLFPPGDPKIDSITPSSGPANGGTPVTITGENLGCVTSVSFGSVVASDATNSQALLDCGSTDTVTVTAPPGAVGTVPVTLTTVESDSTGAPAASGSFTYTKPFALTVKKSGSGSGTVTSSPGGINCGKTCSHAYPFGTLGRPQGEGRQGLDASSAGRACAPASPRARSRPTRALTVTAKFALENCVVPNVAGKSLSAAKRALKSHFCSAGKIKHAFSSTVATGSRDLGEPEGRNPPQAQGEGEPDGQRG